MSETCHYCHEPITDHENINEVADWDAPSRFYHDDCHRLDIFEHRDAGDRLPEDEPGPPLTGIVLSSGYASERCGNCGASGHFACSRWGD